MALLRRTDGRSTEIPDWLYAEHHHDPYVLGLRCEPIGPAIRMPLETARHHNHGTYECVVRLAQTARAANVALAMIHRANRVKK